MNGSPTIADQNQNGPWAVSCLGMEACYLATLLSLADCSILCSRQQKPSAAKALNIATGTHIPEIYLHLKYLMPLAADKYLASMPCRSPSCCLQSFMRCHHQSTSSAASFW